MNYFNDLISNEEHFIDMPDCIADGSSYKETIEKAFKLTDGFLILNDFIWKTSGRNYEFDMVVNEKPLNISVQVVSDHVDSNGVIKGLNQILAHSGYIGDKRFCDINGEVADFGIAFITPDKEQELVNNGLIWREE